jgi:hypothetical protein
MRRPPKLASFARLAGLVLAAGEAASAAARARAEDLGAGEKIPLQIEDLYLADSFQAAVVAPDERKAA